MADRWLRFNPFADGSMSILQITPAFVREAFSLLRQSIIHVEKDDIGLDDDEEEDEEEEVAVQTNGNGHHHTNGDMDADDEDLPDIPTSSAPLTSPTRAGAQQPQPLVAPSPARQATPGPSTTTVLPPMPTPAKKQKVTISYDKYQMIKSLVVLCLSEMERETGEGVARSEIITWYLEQRESEISTVDELEQEKLLVEKVINKLIKVSVQFVDEVKLS